MTARICILCGATIPADENVSHYRVEGDCVGFGCSIDAERFFHDACLTRDEGIDEVARAQVLDYLEAHLTTQGSLEDMKAKNLDRAQKLLKEVEWRRKSPS